MPYFAIMYDMVDDFVAPEPLSAHEHLSLARRIQPIARRIGSAGAPRFASERTPRL